MVLRILKRFVLLVIEIIPSSAKNTSLAYNSSRVKPVFLACLTGLLCVISYLILSSRFLASGTDTHYEQLLAS